MTGMDSFSPIIMYGFEVVVPQDGKFSSEDIDPEEPFIEDEYDCGIPNEIGDLFINNSKIGYYFGNIPHVTLTETCGLCLLMTSGTIAENETYQYYLNGTYGIFLGVIITPEMTPNEIDNSLQQLKEQIKNNSVLQKLVLSENPTFISGNDMSEYAST